MKTIGLFFFAMLVSFGLCAFNNSGDVDKGNGSQKVSIAVLKVFEQKFPQAVGVEWDRELGFYVADFRSPAKGEKMHPSVMHEMEAWFDSDAKWMMTVTDVPFEQLPKVVRDGFTGGSYGRWKVDDARIVERNGKDIIYIIEIGLGEQERDLHFNSKGELVKEMRSTNYKLLLL